MEKLQFYFRLVLIHIVLSQDVLVFFSQLVSYFTGDTGQDPFPFVGEVDNEIKSKNFCCFKTLTISRSLLYDHLYNFF